MKETPTNLLNSKTEPRKPFYIFSLLLLNAEHCGLLLVLGEDGMNRKLVLISDLARQLHFLGFYSSCFSFNQVSEKGKNIQAQNSVDLKAKFEIILPKLILFYVPV